VNQATQFEKKVVNYTKIATQLRVMPSFKMLDASFCAVRAAVLLQKHRNVTALFRLLKVMMLRNFVHSSNKHNTDIKCKDLTKR
jgi:hypothetical protein